MACVTLMSVVAVKSWWSFEKSGPRAIEQDRVCSKPKVLGADMERTIRAVEEVRLALGELGGQGGRDVGVDRAVAGNKQAANAG